MKKIIMILIAAFITMSAFGQDTPKKTYVFGPGWYNTDKGAVNYQEEYLAYVKANNLIIRKAYYDALKDWSGPLSVFTMDDIKNWKKTLDNTKITIKIGFIVEGTYVEVPYYQSAIFK